VKNPDYFVKGRPYLDGVRYVVVVGRGTLVAALQTGQVDVAYPGDTTVAIAEQLRASVPRMVFTAETFAQTSAATSTRRAEASQYSWNTSHTSAGLFVWKMRARQSVARASPSVYQARCFFIWESA